MLQLSSGAKLFRPFPAPDRQPKRTIHLWLLLTLLLSVFVESATAQTPVPADAPRTAKAVRTALPPRIDGRLEDAMWATAEPFTDFIQNEPRDGQPASERTEVRVLFDNEALYIAAEMRDARPEGIVLGESRRDASLDDSDAFLVVLDTFRDQQNGFLFGTNPNGIEYDGQISREGSGGVGGGGRQQAGSGGGFNLNWDGSWEIATSRDTAGWYAEFRIPFSTLRYGGARTQEWGINFARQIRRRNETAFWSPIPRQFDLYRVSLAGALQGIEPPGRRLFTVTPYVLASAERDFFPPESRGTEYPFEVGGDAKLGITPSLTLDFTLNTDFAQVEVDEQQVNLTRFNLFFPEKRPFFLENAGVFAVGTPQTSELFFSRRIGIARNGEVVPIVGGGRMTGKLNGFDIGLLNIQTGEVEGLQPANNYTVARALRELGNRSRIGAIFVNRSATSDLADPAAAALQTEAYNRTFGVDGRLGIGSALTLDAYAAATQTPGLEGREYAYKSAATTRRATGVAVSISGWSATTSTPRLAFWTAAATASEVASSCTTSAPKQSHGCGRCGLISRTAVSGTLMGFRKPATYTSIPTLRLPTAPFSARPSTGRAKGSRSRSKSPTVWSSRPGPTITGRRRGASTRMKARPSR